MKKIRFGVLLFAITALLGTGVFAKTHKTEIVPGEILEFTLEEDDRLLCDIIIEEDGIFSLNLSSLSNDGGPAPKLSFILYKGSKEIYKMETVKPLFAVDDFDVERFGFAAGLTEGEYKLEIKNLTGFSSVSFTAQTNFYEEENIESFGNADFEGATQMLLGEKYYGGVSMLDDADYYSFEMPYNGYAYIQMYTPEPKYFSLFDENKNEIGYIGVAVEQEDRVYELRSGLAAGKYYIKIETDEDFTSPLYTVKVTATQGEYFETEYNNQKEFANPVENTKEYYGNLFGAYDEDIFSFTLEKDGGVIIDFTDTVVSKDGHYSIYLDDGRDILFSSDECGRETAALKLEKGTYYFTVASLGGEKFTNMAYKFKVTADVPLAICPPEEDAGTAENEPDESEKDFRFDDVNETSWYYNDVMEAYREGLVEGTPTTEMYDGHLYSPDVGVTIAEAITMAVRAHSKKYDIEYEYALTGDKWYDFYVDYAKKYGIIKNDFSDYGKKATRAEVAYIFSNLFNDIETQKNTIIPDVDESTEYCDSIHKLYALGILKGDDEKGTFYPKRNLSRAEAAVILLRVHKTK